MPYQSHPYSWATVTIPPNARDGLCRTQDPMRYGLAAASLEVMEPVSAGTGRGYDAATSSRSAAAAIRSSVAVSAIRTW